MSELGIPIIMHGETEPRSPTFVQRLLAGADAAVGAELPAPADVPRFLPARVEPAAEPLQDPITIRAEARARASSPRWSRCCSTTGAPAEPRKEFVP